MDRKSNLADLEKANEHLFRQLTELDEMAIKKGARTINNLIDIEGMTTSFGKRAYSMPRQKDCYYLDLDLDHLQMVQEKLDKEIASIKRRALRVEMKISDIDKEMAEREKQAWQHMTVLSTRRHEKNRSRGKN